jgi:hypothetical protein
MKVLVAALFENLTLGDTARPHGQPASNSRLGSISGRFNYVVLQDGSSPKSTTQERLLFDECAAT